MSALFVGQKHKYMNNNIASNNLFETTDLHLASVLLSLGFSLDSLNKQEPHKAIFIFLRNDNLDSVISDFWDRKLRLEPISILTSLKLIKQRLYSNEP